MELRCLGWVGLYRYLLNPFSVSNSTAADFAKSEIGSAQQLFLAAREPQLAQACLLFSGRSRLIMLNFVGTDVLKLLRMGLAAPISLFVNGFQQIFAKRIGRSIEDGNSDCLSGDGGHGDPKSMDSPRQIQVRYTINTNCLSPVDAVSCTPIRSPMCESD